MHEAGLVTNLLETIEMIVQEQGATRVIAIKIKVGALSHISAEHFTEHFQRESQQTLAEGARLDIETSEDVSDPLAQEIILESIELEME